MDILEKFKRRINWTEFTRRCDEDVLTPEIIDRFKDYFDWKELSKKSSLTIAIAEKYPDLIDWKEIICCYYNDDILTRDFFEKYKEYIPASAFMDSHLWNNIVADIRKGIERKLRSGE